MADNELFEGINDELTKETFAEHFHEQILLDTSTLPYVRNHISLVKEVQISIS
jgi:hypothetical protein